MKNQKTALDVLNPFNEEELREFKTSVETMVKRVKILECLDASACFFPDWLARINESLHSVIAHKQAGNIACNEEKEALVKAVDFFTKMTDFGELLSCWRKELAASADIMERALIRFSGREEL
jgi:hypothetical protein